MQRSVRLLGLVLLIALAASLAFAAKSNADCKAAQDTFQDKCSMCHAPDGKGYAAIHTPNFTDPKWQAAHKDAELEEAITNGKRDEGEMPAFKDQLTKAQIDSLVTCVVRGFGQSKPRARK